MDFIKAVFLAILTFAQIACIILVPFAGAAVLFYFVRAFFNRLTVASFVNCTYEEIVKKERDRANDTTEYQTHLFSPSVVIHHQAYKWVTLIKYRAQYQFTVSDQTYIHVDKGTMREEKWNCYEPPKEMEVYYSPKHPKWNFSKDTFLGVSVFDAGVLVLLFVINLITKGMKIVDWYAYILVGLIYLLPIAACVYAYRRKPTV